MHRTTLRVRYGETDKAGVAWHGSYIAWLEVARCELLRAHGIDYARFEVEEQLFLTVAGIELKYLAPSRYDEELVIESGLQNVEGASARFAQRILRGTQLLTEAVVRVACVDGGGKVRPFPRHLKAALLAASAVGNDATPGFVARPAPSGASGADS